MGKLRNRATRREYVLSSHHLVGRAPRCALQLDNPMASGHHAELRWTGSLWELRDLDSRNGTFLNNAPLSKGERRQVANGALIAFGDPEDIFELVNDGAPGASASNGDGDTQYAHSGTLLLPNAESPQCFVLQDGGNWFIEGPDGSVEPATHGQRLIVGDAVWVLDLPVELQPTLQLGAVLLRTGTLCFKVSRNEEHVELEIVNGSNRLQLPPRIYWYTLLTLARARLRDRGQESEAEEGWLYVDDLVTHQLQIEPTLLYQHVCRAKRALASEGVIDYARLVERRPNSRQIRIGARNIEIIAL